MKKLLFVILFAIAAIFFSSKPALAAPTSTTFYIPQFKPITTYALSPDKHNLTIMFSYALLFRSIQYTLTYNANGVNQGVTGTIRPTFRDYTIARTILLGTCSARSCLYHTNITNMKLLVNATDIFNRNTSQTFNIAY